MLSSHGLERVVKLAPSLYFLVAHIEYSLYSMHNMQSFVSNFTSFIIIYQPVQVAQLCKL